MAAHTGKEEQRRLTTAHYRQLVREGEAQKGHRYRPDAVPQHSLEEVQERLPDRRPQGRSRRHGYRFLIIVGYRDGQGRGQRDGSFSAGGVTMAGHFFGKDLLGFRCYIITNGMISRAWDSVQRSMHRGQVMKNGVTFGLNHTNSFFPGKFRVIEQRTMVFEGASRRFMSNMAPGFRPARAASGTVGKRKRHFGHK